MSKKGIEVVKRSLLSLMVGSITAVSEGMSN